MTRPVSLALLVLLLVAFSYGAPLLGGQVKASDPQAPVSAPVTEVPGVVQPAAAGAQTTPAVNVTTVPSPAAPQNAGDQIMWALAVSFVLRYVTHKGWFPFLTPEASARIKALAGFVAAAGTAAGIHLVVNGSPFDHVGSTITVTGLTFDALKDVGFQWATQQGWYELVVKQRAATT